MPLLNNLGQKLKGKAQQVKGEIEIAYGQSVKGRISKIKGKANEMDANLKMKAEEVVKSK